MTIIIIFQILAKLKLRLKFRINDYFCLINIVFLYKILIKLILYEYIISLFGIRIIIK